MYVALHGDDRRIEPVRGDRDFVDQLVRAGDNERPRLFSGGGRGLRPLSKPLQRPVPAGYEVRNDFAALVPIIADWLVPALSRADLGLLPTLRRGLAGQEFRPERLSVRQRIDRDAVDKWPLRLRSEQNDGVEHATGKLPGSFDDGGCHRCPIESANGPLR